MKHISTLLLLSSIFALPAFATKLTAKEVIFEAAAQNTIAPTLFIDCRRCDLNYIRTEIKFVNYVRDPELADIHVFVTDVPTVGGGRVYQFAFIGRQQFEGTRYTLDHFIDHNKTSDEIRRELTRQIQLGVSSFVLRTPLAQQFVVTYNDQNGTVQQNREEDAWDYWVFQAYIGSVQFNMESNQSNLNSRWGIFADRVTEAWKIRIRPYFNYGYVKIQTDERSEPVFRSNQRHGMDNYALKSINDHWSAGIFATYLTFSQRNIKHEIHISPGIEYSIFPYEESTRKAIKFTYMVGYGYNAYYNETIFNTTQETLFGQQFRGVVNIRQPWGSIETGLVGSHYLHDIDRHRVEFYGQTNLRVFEGFSLSFQAEYNIIRDQLSLPKGSASLEEVLLRQRELATDFFFSSSIAITYTFGSKFTNIVNTRF